jgi:hypothetical protein
MNARLANGGLLAFVLLALTQGASTLAAAPTEPAFPNRPVRMVS